MSTFIAQSIMKKADISLADGRAMYRTYFVNTSIYLKWQADVDTILEAEGYESCIVRN